VRRPAPWIRGPVWLILPLLCLGLAFGSTGCGGGDEDTASIPTTDARGAPQHPDGATTDRPSTRAEDGGSRSTEATGDSTARFAEVDLSTDPGKIEGAVVTSTGAVQTLPPSPKAHRTAQHNSYGSIKAFGSEAEGDEATEITFALVQYLTARAQGDWTTACARLYGVLRADLEELNRAGRAPGSCEETFGALMSRVPRASREQQAEIDVSSVRRGDGDRAFVVYKTPDTLSADMPMYLEDGAWRVGAVEAYVLEPGQGG
jgi:hypothetical protein